MIWPRERVLRSTIAEKYQPKTEKTTVRSWPWQTLGSERREVCFLKVIRTGQKHSTLGALWNEGGKEFVGNRSPAVGIEPQQMAVAGNAMEKVEAQFATGRDECLMILVD